MNCEYFEFMAFEVIMGSDVSIFVSVRRLSHV